MIRRPPRSTQSRSSAASDVYKRQVPGVLSALMLAGSIGLRAWRSPTLVNHDNRHELALATAEPAYASSSGARATDQAVSRDDWQDDVGVRLTFGSVTRAVLGVVVLFTVVI